MAPRLSGAELDRLAELFHKGDTATEIHAKLCASRRHCDGPDLTTVRRALRGATHQRGRVETRGRKRKLSPVVVRKLNTVRKRLIREAAGEREVHLDEIMAKSRVSATHPTTVGRALKHIGVAWRTPREKPLRELADQTERVDICRRWMRYPANYFSEGIDCIIDNSKFDKPTHTRAIKYAKMRRVRGHHRTRDEGVREGFTKPSVKRNKVDPGYSVSVVAGIINNRVKVWHYLPRRWCGAAAKAMYEGPIIKALRRYRGAKRTYRIIEDNDPTGYKSNTALGAKRALGIVAVPFPRYSPDLNPLDYFLWAEVNRRMYREGAAPARESVAGFKKRLRRTAMSIPEAVIRAAVAQMKTRAAAVVASNGGHIACD